MRRYTVDSKLTYWFYVALMPCLFFGVGGFLLFMSLRKPVSGPPVWFPMLWLAGVLYGGSRTITMPHTIEMANDGQILFIGPFRRTVVAPQDIIQIKAVSGQFLEVKYLEGKFRMLQQITGLHVFLSDLERTNQSVILKGC